MENEIPRHILMEMEQIGVMPRGLPDDVPDEPKIPHTFEFNMPDLDENGEPPW
jgi:hypothetical protein